MVTFNEEAKPAPQVVTDFHTNCDVDQDKEAFHHTIGTGATQAAAGSHVHNGADSLMLLDGVKLSGSRGGNTALVSIIGALVKLGAEDATTA